MLIEEAVKNLQFDLKNKKILELGCGTCVFCNEASKIASEVYAIDMENKMKYLAKRSNLFFKIMDARALDYRPMSFDVVVYYETIGFFEDFYQQSLEEALRVIKDNGQIIICSLQAYDRSVLEKKVLKYLKTTDLVVQQTVYKGMQVVHIKKPKPIGVDYRKMKSE